jgi:hypothetical protein
MAKRGSIKEGEEEIQYLMQYAAKLGVQAMYESQPAFKGAEELLMNHIDFKKLRGKAESLYSDLTKNRIRGDKAREYLQGELADYVTSAEFFDEEGNNIFVKRSIREEKPNFLERFASFFKPKSPGEEELNKNVMALRDAYAFYKSGGYDKDVPQLGETFGKVGKYLQEVKSSNFAPAMANIFEGYGVMPEKEANEWRRDANKNYREDLAMGREYVKEIKGGVKTYLAHKKYQVPERIAASILGIAGISLIAVSSKITGAVVGVSNNAPTIAFGSVLIIIAVLLVSIGKGILLKKKHKR